MTTCITPAAVAMHLARNYTEQMAEAIYSAYVRAVDRSRRMQADYRVVVRANGTVRVERHVGKRGKVLRIRGGQLAGVVRLSAAQSVSNLEMGRGWYAL